MKAVTWHGRRDVRVDTVPDPRIEQPTDVVVGITSSGICGSDLHLYEVLGPFLDEGDILGHEPMGVVEEVGPEVTAVSPGDRVVIPSTSPAGRASCAVRACTRSARPPDLVPERLGRALANGVQAMDLREPGLVPAIRDLTDGRGPDAVIDAVGMEAHGSPTAQLTRQMTALLPDAMQGWLLKRTGVDRLHALYLAIDIVRRGGTISLAGVYGGTADPTPMLRMFDKQIQLRMGQANVHRWVDDLLPLVVDGDPLGLESFATHRVRLEQAPAAYQMFQQKRDGAVKVLLQP